MLKQTEFASVYITDTYEHKAQIIKDLEEAKRVVVISSQEDVLAYFGLILEQYGQYNVYLEEDLSIVDKEYLDEVSERDRTKDEVVTFLGTPLSEMIANTIDELKLTDKQKRIMHLCKEVIKGTDDTKSRAIISTLNDKVNKLKIELENTQEELKTYKTEGANASEGTVIHVSTVNLDNLLSKTRIMYIREYSRVNFLDSLLVSYVDFLDKMCRKRVKMIIIDDKAEYNYPQYSGFKTIDEYISARKKYNTSNIITNKVVITPLITDLYKSDVYDLIIILDKNVAKSNLVKGKNVKLYTACYYDNSFKYSQEKDIGAKFITDKHLDYKDSIVIPEIEELKDKSLSKDEQLYYYKQIINDGKDNRCIFDIFNEDNKIKVEEF